MQNTSLAFDLVMFDLDGTLIETAPEICDAVNDTLRSFELPAVSQDHVDRWIGHGTHELLVQALAHAGRQAQEAVRRDPVLPDIASVFGRHYEARCGTRSRLYPHVLPVLRGLRERGVRLALVTNKEERYTQRVLASHALQACFDHVVCGDSLPTKKPDPAGIHSCLRVWGVPPPRALFVGDSSIDVATARNADVAVWALPYGYNMGQPIAASQPDRVIESCLALLA
jgi:phosphoglycolate phosphatase